jgi:hypothetical protein
MGTKNTVGPEELDSFIQTEPTLHRYSSALNHLSEIRNLENPMTIEANGTAHFLIWRLVIPRHKYSGPPPH